MQKFDEIFINNYAPSTFEELKIPVRINNLLMPKFESFKSNPNYKLRILLYGTAGTGKTTTSKLIIKMLGADIMFLSGSNDFTIDTMREKVYPFCTNHASISGRRKIIIVDEYERIQPRVQDAFKALMDSTNTGFVLITNHINKVIPPIISRCGGGIEYNFVGKEINEQKMNYAQLMARIINENNIGADNDGLTFLVNKFFPDFRRGIETLQQFYDTKQALNLENLGYLIDEAGTDTELYEALSIRSDADFFTKMSEYKTKEEETFSSLGNPFFAWLNKQNMPDKTVKIAPIVGKWSNQLSTSHSNWTTLFSCMCEIRGIMLK